MSHVVDTRPCGYDGQPLRCERAATIVLVGCGGTGSFLADALCRLLIGWDARVYLIDMDRVEPHNVGRQAFDRREVGRFKAEVLAERLAQRYGRAIDYAVAPYDGGTHAGSFADGTPSALNLLVSAVDNAAARRALAATIEERDPYGGWGALSRHIWLLDCGNARNSGQVLLGNTMRPEALRGAFLRREGRCRALPAPGLQRPDLLVSPPEPERSLHLDCAEAIAQELQGPTINQVVAAIAASMVEKLLAGTCAWMGVYFDLDAGTLRPVPAEPATVAAIAGLSHNAVVPPSGRNAPAVA
ncbi:MAG TPA: ThiF family adenylyltransferase [Nitrolancea sp.]|nr:ThiF family adenylyltransferase [Nitrolancea sp.]